MSGRESQGLTAKIIDPVVLARVAALLLGVDIGQRLPLRVDAAERSVSGVRRGA